MVRMGKGGLSYLLFVGPDLLDPPVGFSSRLVQAALEDEIGELGGGSDEKIMSKSSGEKLTLDPVKPCL